MIPLTYEQNRFHKKQKFCDICKKEFNTDKNDKNQTKLYHKKRDHCHYTGKYRGATHSIWVTKYQLICSLRYKIPKEIPAIFHNGSTFDHHVIIKELAKEVEGQFECIRENTKQYI